MSENTRGDVLEKLYPTGEARYMSQVLGSLIGMHELVGVTHVSRIIDENRHLSSQTYIVLRPQFNGQIDPEARDKVGSILGDALKEHTHDAIRLPRIVTDLEFNDIVKDKNVQVQQTKLL